MPEFLVRERTSDPRVSERRGESGALPRIGAHSKPPAKIERLPRTEIHDEFVPPGDPYRTYSGETALALRDVELVKRDQGLAEVAKQERKLPLLKKLGEVGNRLALVATGGASLSLVGALVAAAATGHGALILLGLKAFGIGNGAALGLGATSEKFWKKFSRKKERLQYQTREIKDQVVRSQLKM